MSTVKYDDRLNFERKDASHYVKPKGLKANRTVSRSKLESERLSLPVHNERRPTKRSECPTSRPCPWVSCRYHLFLDPGINGDLRLNFIGLDVAELRFSCALDVIEANPEGMLPGEMCLYFGLTRERTRQLLVSAMEKVAKHGDEMRFLESTKRKK